MTRSTRTLALATTLLALVVSSPAAGGIVGKGLKLGLSSADMTGLSTDPGLTPRAGFATGAFVAWGLTRILSVQPEILYVQKGAEAESGAQPYEYQFSYLEVPVLWKLIPVSPGAAFRPNVCAGAFVGLRIDAKTETYLDPGQEESREESLRSARGIDAGYTLGGGADLILGPGRALLDVRYGRSLLSAVTTGAAVRHEVLTVFLGYSFN